MYEQLRGTSSEHKMPANGKQTRRSHLRLFVGGRVVVREISIARLHPLLHHSVVGPGRVAPVVEVIPLRLNVLIISVFFTEDWRRLVLDGAVRAIPINFSVTTQREILPQGVT